MEQVFSYIIGLGAAVMMPVIFTILGLCIGIKFSESLKSGLKVGVGFIGLSIVTALLTSALGPALDKVVNIYDLQLKVFDMGWPAAASVAYNTAVGAFIIPVCLGVNLLMLITKTTRTVNIDLWNYWHFAFIGAVVYFASSSLTWGFFAAIVCYIVTLIIADMTARKFQTFYKDMDGISIPQPFCAGFVPFAWGINKVLDMIPGMNRLEIDAEGLKKKFGLLGEPLFLGVVVGIVIGCLTCTSGAELVDKIPYILGLGIKMGAVMELIPRVTVLFIEGLRPISEATRQLIARKFKGADGLNIGMTPALVIGHPTTLVVSILLIPVTLVLAATSSCRWRRSQVCSTSSPSSSPTPRAAWSRHSSWVSWCSPSASTWSPTLLPPSRWQPRMSMQPQVTPQWPSPPISRVAASISPQIPWPG